MKSIRIMALYRYFLGTLQDTIDAAYLVKANYTSGKTSYKRAYKQMDNALRFAWQRYRLCYALSDMLEPNSDNMKLQDANSDLKFLTEWTIS